MRQEDWTFWVDLVKDGGQYGLLLKRCAPSVRRVEAEYFYSGLADGLSDTEEIRDICERVNKPVQSQDERKILGLLKSCAEFLAGEGGDVKAIPLKRACTLAPDSYATEMRRLFDREGEGHRHEGSRLRAFLVSWGVFKSSVLCRPRGKHYLEVNAQAFRVYYLSDLAPKEGFDYLKRIQEVLYIGRDRKARPLRRSGPRACDFDAGLIYPRADRLDELKELLRENAVSLLIGDPATGKSVLVLELAYRLWPETCVRYFNCDEHRGFDRDKLLTEIRSARGLVIIENIHLSAENIQFVCGRLVDPDLPRVLFTGRTSLKEGQRLRLSDLTELPTMHLTPFEDVEKFIEYFAGHTEMPEDTRREVITASKKSFWLLAYALEGYVDSGGIGDPGQWIADGVQKDLEELEKLEEPHAALYPEILVSLSPLYMKETLTAASYLRSEFRFPKAALNALVNRGEITRQRTPERHVMYGLPHSALAEAYWEHGLEYRRRLGLTNRRDAIKKYLVAGAPNCIQALSRLEESLHQDLALELYRESRIPEFIRRECTVSSLAQWYSRRKMVAEIARDPDVLKAISERLSGLSPGLVSAIAHTISLYGNPSLHLFWGHVGSGTIAQCIDRSEDASQAHESLTSVRRSSTDVFEAAIQEINFRRYGTLLGEITEPLAFVVYSEPVFTYLQQRNVPLTNVISLERIARIVTECANIEDVPDLVLFISRLDKSIAAQVWGLIREVFAKRLEEKAKRRASDDYVIYDIFRCFRKLSEAARSYAIDLFALIDTKALGVVMAQHYLFSDIEDTLDEIRDLGDGMGVNMWAATLSVLCEDPVKEARLVQFLEHLCALAERDSPYATAIWQETDKDSLRRAMSKMERAPEARARMMNLLQLRGLSIAELRNDRFGGGPTQA